VCLVDQVCYGRSGDVGRKYLVWNVHCTFFNYWPYPLACMLSRRAAVLHSIHKISKGLVSLWLITAFFGYRRLRLSGTLGIRYASIEQERSQHPL
jgi:hypothetical protein